MNKEYEQHIIKELCPTMGVQEVEVGVPVCIKAFAHVGKVKTECIGNAEIIPGAELCKGKPDGVCKFIISQKIKIEIPVMFGVLTTENIEQAIERAGTKAGNKGYDCAVAAIEMVNLIREIEA